MTLGEQQCARTGAGPMSQEKAMLNWMNWTVETAMADIATAPATPKPQGVSTLEERIIRELNKLSYSTAHRVVHLFAHYEHAEDFCERVQAWPLVSTEDLVGLVQDLVAEHQVADTSWALWEWAEELVRQKDLKKLAQKRGKFMHRTRNKAMWVWEPVYYGAVRPDREQGTKFKWSADPEGRSSLRNRGIITRIVEAMHGPQEEPVCVQFVGAPRAHELGEDGMPTGPEMNQIWDKLLELGIAVSKGRLGFNMKSPGWPLLVKLFPKAIWFQAYAHRGISPILPEGWFENFDMKFETLMRPAWNEETGDYRGELVETGNDGAGRYNPHHPDWEVFITKYGVAPLQFTFIDVERSVFAKGTLDPDESLPSEVSAVCDWNQIKGCRKDLAKTRRAEHTEFTMNGFLAIHRVWNKRSWLNSGFELGENIDHTKARPREIFYSNIEEALHELVEGGVDELVAEAARRSPQIAYQVKLCHVLRKNGHDVHPVQFDRIKRAVEDRLGKKLYRIAQGGGMRFPKFKLTMDARIPSGYCCVPGLPVGTKVAAFRFPIVEAAGLMVLTNMEAPPDHMVGGGLPAFKVIVSVDDFPRAQYDDDGDELGISPRADHVELFENYRTDNRVFVIEPEGVELTLPNGEPIMTNTPEGLKFIRVSARGDVGGATNIRRDLLALGELEAAQAASVLIQEMIDKAKRMPAWTDVFALAEDPELWTEDEQGYLRATCRASYQLLDKNGDFNMKAAWGWLGDFKEKHLMPRDLPSDITPREMEKIREKVRRTNVCPWYDRNGRLSPREMKPCAEKSSFRGGNMVHLSYDHTYKIWMEVRDQMNLEVAPQDITDLLPMALETIGIQVNIELEPWGNYLRGWRAQSGIKAFGSKYREIMNREAPVDPEFNDQEARRRSQAIEMAYNDLETSLARIYLKHGIAPLLHIWAMEMTPHYKVDGRYTTEWEEGATRVNNPNHAWRAISFRGSPIMKVLGISEDKECDFMDHARLIRSLDYIFNSDDPFETLNNLLERNTIQTGLHEEQTGIPIISCRYCMNRLQMGVVQRIRSNRKHIEHTWMRRIAHEANKW